jgi:hypothetical protein
MTYSTFTPPVKSWLKLNESEQCNKNKRQLSFGIIPPNNFCLSPSAPSLEQSGGCSHGPGETSLQKGSIVLIDTSTTY